MTGNWFKLRHELSSRTVLLLEVVGFGLLILIWFLLTLGINPAVPPAILPAPAKVLGTIPALFTEYEIIRNICRSLGLNLGAYIEALSISLPLGYVIGLFPIFKNTLSKPIDALRFVPLTAVTGLFIVWFGIGTAMKLHFLAFGIFIYLLPVVVQRIQELDDIYVKTVYTLGANNWQTIKTVFIPGVVSRLSDDIRVLTAISWTYIIIAESLGNQGGIGALIWRVGQRQQRVEVLFALVFIIILIGFLQDKVFTSLDRTLFPHKYQQLNQVRKALSPIGTALAKFGNLAINLALGLYLIVYIVLVLDTYFKIAGGLDVLNYLFADTLWAIHIISAILLVFKVKKWFFNAT
jgi:ABC-type nitrate/sulfonate/bicarbonate transport system permease component